MSWFAERADRILVLFDAHKLDISDEFDNLLTLIRPHSEKVIINCCHIEAYVLITNFSLTSIAASIYFQQSRHTAVEGAAQVLWIPHVGTW